MEYSRLIAVTGMTGLFEMMTSKSDGAIVKSLEDGTTKFVTSRVHQFSHLESIEIYTTTENANLIDVMKAMEASTDTIPSDKDAVAVKSYLMKVFPNLDDSRVYVSDMKKMIKWYNILKANNVELKLSSEGSEEAETEDIENAEVEAVVVTEAAPKKAAKKAKAK